MNAVADKPTTATEARTLVFELVDQQKSSFFRNEDESDSDSNKVYISTCTRKISNSSSIEVLEDGIWKRKRTRYIKGCDEIFVEQQDKTGWKPNPHEDAIWFNKGKLEVAESGISFGLFKYLTQGYNGNINLEVKPGKTRRPEHATAVCTVIDTAGEAENTEDIRDVKFEVDKFLHSLKSKGAKGKVVYNEEAIGFLCSVFKLPKYATGFKSEAWVALSEKADENPALFLSSIAGKRALVEAEVNQSIALGVIKIGPTDFAWAETDKLIKVLPAASNDAEKLNMVIDFFGNPDNVLNYDQLRTLLNAKKMESSGVVS